MDDQQLRKTFNKHLKYCLQKGNKPIKLAIKKKKKKPFHGGEKTYNARLDLINIYNRQDIGLRVTEYNEDDWL